jgi:solute:Na+ symporter, SSS family
VERIDWLIFGAYLLVVFLVGIWVTKKAGKGIESYFVADRSLPWWWLGISIIATTFAADTPLAVTGITANNGIVGNWLWWSWAATYITVAIFFAKRWRKSGVLTDVEFIEMRYDGHQAAFLRGFKAFFFGVVLNAFILGWVITAAVKIAGPFIQWGEITPSGYAFFESVYPAFLLFKGDVNATLTILLLLLIVLVYSSLGGIRGVILTDLFQFAIAMVTSIMFAWLAVKYVGGIQPLKEQIVSLYGSEHAGNLTEFLPSFNNPLLPLQIFFIYIFVQWWVRYDSDGTGYIAQRINTAKNPDEAQKGALFFAIAFIALRTWPWIVVALVTLVVFPMADPTMFSSLGEHLVDDREMGYPILMKLILPAGLLGLTFTSLMAAFMSTVDTHLNWGASYLANDIYRRFIRPEANEKELVRFSRWMVFAITVLAVVVSSQMGSIAGAWKFFINAAAGLGIAQMLRWLWWRANAFTEISAMVTALIATFVFTYFTPENPGDHYESYALVLIALISIVVSVVATWFTPPVKAQHLQVFVNKCNPVGWWSNFQPEDADGERESALKNFARTLLIWCFAMTLSFAGLFAIGYFIMLEPTKGAACLLLSAVSYYFMQKLIDKENSSQSL